MHGLDRYMIKTAHAVKNIKEQETGKSYPSADTDSSTSTSGSSA